MGKPSVKQFERCYKILEYLRKHTDENHKVSQAELRRCEELKECLGTSETFNEYINLLASTINSDETGKVLEENEWKIVFDAFKMSYGKGSEYINEDEIPEDNNGYLKIKNLYYQHEFSYDDLERMIESLYFSKTVSKKEADEISEKIVKYLANDFYSKRQKNILKVSDDISETERTVIADNLDIIQEAIENNVQISFYFNGYNRKNELVKSRNQKHTVSPYYIVADDGKYYLLACNESYEEKKTWIYRIDLMSEIEIPNKNKRLKINGDRATNKKDVKNLPLKWDEKFQFEHLNMSYDEPVMVKVRIYSPKGEDKKISKKPDYTFLHDSFGGTFKFVETDKTDPDYDIFRVKCSPYGITNWALEFSDRVEILEPQDVRDRVIEKIQKLNAKYEEDKSKVVTLHKKISSSNYLLKLDRNNDLLRVYKKVETEKIRDYYSLRKDFSMDNYVVYEEIKQFNCIFGCSETPTPFGVFQVENKSYDWYITPYRPKNLANVEKLKFQGYLEIFEDYFIHSDIFAKNTDGTNEIVGTVKDGGTTGCVRVNSDDLKWLLDNIPVKTTVML